LTQAYSRAETRPNRVPWWRPNHQFQRFEPANPAARSKGTENRAKGRQSGIGGYNWKASMVRSRKADLPAAQSRDIGALKLLPQVYGILYTWQVADF